jgi:hypothetical protein
MILMAYSKGIKQRLLKLYRERELSSFKLTLLITFEANKTLVYEDT